MRLLKSLLPDRSMPMRVWRGPFRGASVVMNPRHSMRKVLGVYEHELNAWLEDALPRVSRVIDVGANDGYFTFGCAAAFRRMGRTAEIIAIEAQQQHLDQLRASARQHAGVGIELIHAYAGAAIGDGVVTLDSLDTGDRERTLIKIDVEGAEEDVIAGARQWLRPSNEFLIEVHAEAILPRLTATFAANGLSLRQVDQQPLWWLGRETREAGNWWLVSDRRRP
jgi:precorrin-6B methylase 2